MSRFTEIAGEIPDLSALNFEVAYCKKCPLHLGRTCAVPGSGHRFAELMFVGEGPGEQEDRQGLPFVGRSGELLTQALTRAGLTRDTVFITNVVKCRPPNNRVPLPKEVASCLPYLDKQIELIRPKVVVALGRIAAGYLLERQIKITKERGKLDFLPRDPNVLVSIAYHPSYVLRNRNTQVEQDFFQDIFDARRLIHGNISPAPVST